MALPKQPETRRLLQSAQVAMPLTEDPLADLAGGLRQDRKALEGALRDLHESGGVRGVFGEPNVAMAAAREQFTEASAEPPREGRGTVIRWQGRDPEGRSHWSRFWMEAGDSADACRSAGRFHKSGFQLSFRDGPEELLRPGNERSLLVRGPALPMPEQLPRPAKRLADMLFRPVPFDPEEVLWPQLARAARIDAAEVLPALRYILRTGLFRRFALALSPTALGWRGCGLAVWTFGEAEEALIPQAAAALAALSGTGDVARRGPELHALFLGREPGTGETAAGEVARQWGRPLARWVDLRP